MNASEEHKDLHENVCEERVFSSLFTKHATDLHNFLYYKYGDRLNPQDKMQEAFVKLWENCKKVKPSKAKSYLFTVANNLMLNAIAHQKVVLKYQKIKPRSQTNENPEFLMEEDQYMEKLQNALAGLTEAQRTAFLLNRIEGKKHKEIAEMLGISTKAVEKRIYSALNKLRETIKEL
ncbi:MAG: RNA polymerase sigma factor [Bacteroidia bacterium]|nr:RNA polymerase sigma factor [Bacteroidia bacterium]MBT8268449.1 RNA polymerase sigma factor [Bacteroidia bacterium]NNK69436.1 sigma-70 family RNA polymerase sigma factor [Flavobacteriaceae bacterium]NNL78878.1 sigma-70 family RNA polymerase sigma factor [Flavobacteriaceae bacterium]